MSNKVPKRKPSMRAVAAEAAARREAQASKRRLMIGVVAAAAVVLVAVVTAGVLVANGGQDQAVAHSQESVTLGCVSCHSTDGSRREGPTWKGLAGSTVELADGTTVVADEAYLRASIQDPRAQVVAGFDASMPDNQATDEQVVALVAFIQSLE
jgi:cytochrome c1